MTIFLSDVLELENPGAYKLHLACKNKDGIEPLDEFVADPKEWLGWNEYRGRKNDWTRPYVLAFMRFYPRAEAWLFGGGFEVMDRREDGYTLRPLPVLEKYVGRLIILFHRTRGMRGRAFNLERHLEQCLVSQVLAQVYDGENFPGFEHLCHDFNTLEALFRNERPDWMASLKNVKGVYVIADKSNGKLYLGSATGDAGLWASLAWYLLGHGHGGNTELENVLQQHGPVYARVNFRFSLLEVFTSTTPDTQVLTREAHWKRALLTREFGYNRQ